MKTRPLEMTTDTESVESVVGETNESILNDFTQDESISLLWLRQWYQNGGSDRIEVIRHLEFFKLLLSHDRIEL